MLGQALFKECCLQGYDTYCSTRDSATLSFDLLHPHNFSTLLDHCHPDIVINAAAVVDLSFCESHPKVCFTINGEAVCVMADACNARDIAFIHISTDHFFTDDRALPHSEDAPMQLLNSYAKSKAHGEACAAPFDKTLIIRTNITGFRENGNKPTFIEWAVNALRKDEPIQGFDDFFTSTIDTVSFSRALLELAEKNTYGIINLASRDVSSKYDFLQALSKAMPDAKAPILKGSVAGLSPKRAESLGLDVHKAQGILNQTLPDLQQVITNLLDQEKSFANDQKIHKNNRLNANEAER